MSNNTHPDAGSRDVSNNMASGNPIDHAPTNPEDPQTTSSFSQSTTAQVQHSPQPHAPFQPATDALTNWILQQPTEYQPATTGPAQLSMPVFSNTNSPDFDVPRPPLDPMEADPFQFPPNNILSMDNSTHGAFWNPYGGTGNWQDVGMAGGFHSLYDSLPTNFETNLLGVDHTASASQDTMLTDWAFVRADLSQSPNNIPPWDPSLVAPAVGSDNLGLATSPSWLSGQDFSMQASANAFFGGDPNEQVGYSPGRSRSRASSYGSSASGVSHPPRSKRGLKKVVRMKYSDRADKSTKRVGRRKGPLLPEQRKQASEIRKLRACLRCKFLKKTCDKGEPCSGCLPSHARLWQVPCTRINIQDIGYFMKDWKADYVRQVDRGLSIHNIKGFSQKETLLWITHGYGFALPVMVREVYVDDDNCFSVDWVECSLADQGPIDFETKTEKLDVGMEGVRLDALSEYLDKHIDGPFEDFIDDYFEGTPFITQILQTAHRYYVKEKSPAIRKAIKLVLAYNLTMNITMVENQVDGTPLDGQIDDEDSKYYGRTVAPVMVNFQIKCALADMWRELHKDVLEEISSLYSAVYNGDKLKNWPTIFILTSIVLVVWEEMQFDCHYRVPDPVVVDKFCLDMESTPVGVIVGLFHAISQKLPAFKDWETSQHGHVLFNNRAACEALTEVRQYLITHEAYLRTRKDAKFDRNDFDSLSNKFLSKLVLQSSGESH